MKKILKYFPLVLSVLMLAASVCSCISASEKAYLFEEGNVISFTISPDAMTPGTKSAFTGSENYIGSVQVLVYDDTGNLYSSRYFSDYSSGMKLSLRDDGTYKFLLLCNCPEIPEASIPTTLTAARTYDVSLSEKIVAYGLYPDGLPMSGEDSFAVNDDMSHTFYVRRMVSKWKIRYGNSDADYFGFSVSSVKLGNCPADFQPWTDWQNGSWSSPVSACVEGDWAVPSDLAAMSSDLTLDGTNYAYFYMLENCQGVQAGITDYGQRDPDHLGMALADKCTYAEVTLSCDVDSGWGRASGEQTAAGDVVYRVYLGRNDTDDFNVYRNTENTLFISDNAGSVAFDIQYGSNDSWQAEYHIVPVDSQGQTQIWFKYPTYHLSSSDPLGMQVLNPATASPLHGRTVVYTSDDESVCTVAADGTITAVGVGTTQVRASVPGVTVGLTFWNAASTSCTITVENAPASSLTIDPETWIGPWGQVFTIDVTDKDPSSGTVSWESSDPSVATVDPSTGEVTTVHPGECTIIATLSASGHAAATAVCRLTVLKQQANLSLSPSTFYEKHSLNVFYGNCVSTVSSNSNAPIRWKSGLFDRLESYSLGISFPDYPALGGSSVNLSYTSTVPATWEWPAIDSGTTYTVKINGGGSQIKSGTTHIVIEQDENELYYAGMASITHHADYTSGNDIIVDFTAPNSTFTYSDYSGSDFWPTVHGITILVIPEFMPYGTPITISGIPPYFNEYIHNKTNPIVHDSFSGSFTIGCEGNDIWTNASHTSFTNLTDLTVDIGYFGDPASAVDRMRELMTNFWDIDNGVITVEHQGSVTIYSRKFTISASTTVNLHEYTGSCQIIMRYKKTKG